MNHPTNQLGKKIQNYIFNYSDFLGSGNFSKCYKGINELTNDIVAIKIIQLNSLKSKKLQQLLFQQIQILKKLNHPTVLKCYQIFTSNRNCYIITELCNQGNLQNKLKIKGILNQQEANPIIKDVYNGLVYLAQHNIVHRDLKSANIFINNGRAKIADFGFAKEINHNFKDFNIGSPLYMAPQGILHNIYGPKTQVWALGILVYQLFHGNSPYNHCKTEDQLKRAVSMPLNWNQLRADLSSDIKQFILTCLEVNQQKRITIQQLGNLNYIRRINQYNNEDLTNKINGRSPSRSIHGPMKKMNQNQGFGERVNNNFRQILTQDNVNRNNNFAPTNNNNNLNSNNNIREQSGRKFSNGKVAFLSVDTRNNNFQSNKVNVNSPKRSLLPQNNIQLGSPSRRALQQNFINPQATVNNKMYLNSIQYSQNQDNRRKSMNKDFQQQNNLLQPNNKFLQQSINNNENLFQSDNFQQIALKRPLSNMNSLNSTNNLSQNNNQFPDNLISGFNSMNNGFFNTNNKINNQNINHTQNKIISSSQNFQSGLTISNNLVAMTKRLPIIQNNIFIDKITFRQAIFFIHHCRLIYKFLQIYKDSNWFQQSSYLIIYKYLLTVLSQLKTITDKNWIIADSQKSTNKIKKLSQVNLQYFTKYQKKAEQFNYFIQPEKCYQTSLSYIFTLINQLFSHLNTQIFIVSRKNYLNVMDQNLVILGHLIIIIKASLSQIEKAISIKNYKNLNSFKQIETVLNTAREQFTCQSYRKYREKFVVA